MRINAVESLLSGFRQSKLPKPVDLRPDRLVACFTAIRQLVKSSQTRQKIRQTALVTPARRGEGRRAAERGRGDAAKQRQPAGSSSNCIHDILTPRCAFCLSNARSKWNFCCFDDCAVRCGTATPSENRGSGKLKICSQAGAIGSMGQVSR